MKDMPYKIGFMSTVIFCLSADGIMDKHGPGMFRVAFILYLAIIVCCWYWETVARKEDKCGK